MVTRVAARQAGQLRVVRAIKNAVSTTARATARLLHQLWLEVTGFIFLVMAGIGGIALAHEYARYQSGRAGSGRVVLAICFTLTFAWFGVSSFWRVRRKTRGRAR